MPAVTAVWGTGWTQDVAVVVPVLGRRVAAQAGTPSQMTTQIAAVAVSAGDDPLSGKPYGQRLIVNPDAFARLSAIGQQITVRHEITHIAAAQADRPDVTAVAGRGLRRLCGQPAQRPVRGHDREPSCAPT